MQIYNLAPGRINRLKGEILAHAIPVEVLGITGQQKRMPKNSGDTVIYRKWLPYGATATNGNTQNRPIAVPGAHQLPEGVTPEAETMTPLDITCTLQQYGCLYALSDKTYDLYEDDVAAEMKTQTGERMGLVREMIRYGVLKGCTNVFYGGTGTSVATVNGKITLSLIRKATRNLKANHGKMIRQILGGSPNFNTSPVEAAYLVFCHTDLESDIRDLPGFKHVAEYAQRQVVHEMEIGSCESFRFVLSPELASVPNAGASAAANTTLLSTGGSSIDVYPIIIAAQDAWGQLALRGVNSLDPTMLMPGQKDKNDPLGQRGYIGAKFWMNCVILNQGWMAVLQVGADALA